MGSISSSLTRDQTWAPCIDSVESQPLGPPGKSLHPFLLKILTSGQAQTSGFKTSRWVFFFFSVEIILSLFGTDLLFQVLCTIIYLFSLQRTQKQSLIKITSSLCLAWYFTGSNTLKNAYYIKSQSVVKFIKYYENIFCSL